MSLLERTHRDKKLSTYFQADTFIDSFKQALVEKSHEPK